MLLSSVCHRHSINNRNYGEQETNESQKILLLKKKDMNNLLKCVFLYGTLKTVEQNHYLLMREENGFARFMEKAVTKEKLPLVVATQYHIPFLLNKPGSGDFVSGEIFEVDEKMLKVLDNLENVGDLYDREVMTFNSLGLNKRKDIDAFVYVLNRYPKGLLSLPMINEYNSENVKAYVPPRERTNGSSKEVLWKEYE